MKRFLKLTVVLVLTFGFLTSCNVKRIRPTWNVQIGNPAIVVVENKIKRDLLLEIDGISFLRIPAFQIRSGNIQRHTKSKKYVFSIKIFNGRSFSKILSVRPGGRILISVFRNRRGRLKASFKRG